jgi:hypothetical protein
MTTAPFDLAAALRDPARYFSEPQDVVATTNLSRDAKLQLFDQWEHDARALAVAEEEGLDGGEQPMLARVQHARRQLGGTDSTRTHGATKHG